MCNENALSVLDDWWNLADRLVVKYSNGMINDFENDTTVFGGYPNWWNNDTGYQYGPRIYQVGELQQIEGVVYVNEMVQTDPGTELEYIREHQCPTCREVDEGEDPLQPSEMKRWTPADRLGSSYFRRLITVL
jgi:hypothetical protein